MSYMIIRLRNISTDNKQSSLSLSGKLRSRIAIITKSRSNFTISSYLNGLPTTGSKFVVLKSPHINKKAKDAYTFLRSNSLFTINFNFYNNISIYNYIILYINISLTRLYNNSTSVSYNKLFSDYSLSQILSTAPRGFVHYTI